MTTTFIVLKQEVTDLLEILNKWKHIEPEGLALQKLCQLLLEDDSHLTKLTSVDKTKDVSLIFKDLNASTQNFIQRDQQGQDLWGNMLWKTRRDILISQYRLTWQSALFDQLNPLMKKALSRPFPFYYTVECYKEDMMIKEKDVKATGGEDEASYRYYLSLFDQAKVPDMWTTFMKKYQHQFGPWDDITRDCLSYLLCTDGHEMNIYSYIAVTREYGFPLDMEKLPLMMLSPPPAPSEQARVETARMIMDLVTYFSSKEMRDHLVALYTWFKGCDKRNKTAMQDRANEWAQAIQASRTKTPQDKNWTSQDDLADRVDLARRTISLFYQKYMVMWRMGQFARDLFTDVDFPGKARILEMKEHVLPLDIANYHNVIHGDPAKWEAKRPKVYNFLDQVIKQT